MLKINFPIFLCNLIIAQVVHQMQTYFTKPTIKNMLTLQHELDLYASSLIFSNCSHSKTINNVK